jgi:hypothetical protein
MDADEGQLPSALLWADAGTGIFRLVVEVSHTVQAVKVADTLLGLSAGITVAAVVELAATQAAGGQQKRSGAACVKANVVRMVGIAAGTVAVLLSGGSLLLVTAGLTVMLVSAGNLGYSIWQHSAYSKMREELLQLDDTDLALRLVELADLSSSPMSLTEALEELQRESDARVRAMERPSMSDAELKEMMLAMENEHWRLHELRAAVDRQRARQALDAKQRGVVRRLESKKTL